MKVDLEKLRAMVLNSIVETTGLKVEEVTVEFKLQENDQIDELDIVTVVMDIERDYEVELSDDDIGKLTTVEELVAYVYSKLEKDEPTTKTDEDKAITNRNIKESSRGFTLNNSPLAFDLTTFIY